MKWEVCVLTECSIGGGEEINGFEDGGPPTLCQPASQQGAERRWKPGRRSLEGVGGALGPWGKFLVSFTSIKKSTFIHLWAGDWQAWPVPMYQFLAELNGRRYFGWKWKFYFCNLFSLCILLSVLDTVWMTKVFANKSFAKYFQASEKQ